MDCQQLGMWLDVHVSKYLLNTLDEKKHNDNTILQSVICITNLIFMWVIYWYQCLTSTLFVNLTTHVFILNSNYFGIVFKQSVENKS